MKKYAFLTALLGLMSTSASHAATLSTSATVALGSHPILGILIPGLGVDVKTRTIAGWVMALGILYSGYKTFMAMNKSNDEREKEKRAEDIKFAWITFISVLGVTAILASTGIISFTDMTSALNTL